MPRRSQRTRSVLTFFAEDAATRTLLYANADLSKASQNREVIAFADHWKAVTGHDPALLIFDSKLTTQAVLAELDDRKIGFITLRARHPGITKTLAALPASAWKPMTLGRAGNKTRRVEVHDDPAAQLSAYPRPIRQLAVTGLGHDQPTLLITNQPQLPARQVIQSYARRMNIEQRLAEAIQSFSLDALAGAVPLNVDLDVACRSWPTPSAPRCAAACPATPPPPPTPSSGGSSTPAASSNTTAARPPSGWPGAPTHHPAPGQPARNDHRALVGRPDPPLPVRLTQLGADSLSENRR